MADGIHAACGTQARFGRLVSFQNFIGRLGFGCIFDASQECYPSFRAKAFGRLPNFPLISPQCYLRIRTLDGGMFEGPDYDFSLTDLALAQGLRLAEGFGAWCVAQTTLARGLKTHPTGACNVHHDILSWYNGTYLGLKGISISLLWGLSMYYSDTWSLWDRLAGV